MRIRGILFDKDGTLIDIIATWLPVYREMLAEAFPGRNSHWDEMMLASGYDPASNNFKANSMLAVGTTDQLVDLWWPNLTADERQRRIGLVDEDFKTKSGKYLRPLVQLEELFSQIRKRGINIGIATNDNESSARSHIVQLKIEALVDFIAGYDSVARAKPAGDMVHAFCAACGLLPAEVAVVGDNPHDLAMGQAAGAGLVIGVLTGNSVVTDFGDLADAILDSVAELPRFLDRM